MRVTRVHVATPLEPGTRVPLPEAASAHLVRVLRLQAGDRFVLFNGDGFDYDACIVAVDRRGVEAEVVGGRRVDNESPLRIVLLQGIARGEKMDLVLQKATELGVVAVLPVGSERSEVRLRGERAGKRAGHWRNVVAAACEQCGRARLPDVADPQPLAVALQGLPPGLRLLLDPEAGRSMATLALPPGEAIVLAVGPEGGWSPRDRESLQSAGFSGVRLGPRILRTETAGLAAIAALQSRFGDLA